MSSERRAVHVFRLGSDHKRWSMAVAAGASASSSPNAGGSGSGRGCDSANILPEPVDGTMQGLDGGHDVFIEKMTSVSVFMHSLFLLPFYYYCLCAFAKLCWCFLALHYEESPCRWPSR